MKESTTCNETQELSDELRAKLDRCREIIRGLGKVVVAFSGGVDSTLLLALSAETLGRDNVLAVIAKNPSLPARELAAAGEAARAVGVGLLEVETGEVDDPKYAANPPDRCYHCKKIVMSTILQAAKEKGFHLLVCGANADDPSDYRPGLAAAGELGIPCPLMDAGLTKQEIRTASRAMGLATWDKPSSPCLASRIPYGQRITAERLARIEKAEDLLKDLGFVELRVRDHGDMARIEVPVADMHRAMELRERIAGPIKDLGYRYVALDLQGFRSGSMNEALAAGGKKA